MRLDPKVTADHWRTWLGQRASETWGSERAQAIDPALRRMAEALADVMTRTPRDDTSIDPQPEGNARV